MSRMTCFDPGRALHDRRFRRKLSGWEFRDFLVLLWFAADECREEEFIPAKKIGDLKMELGMTGKDGRERFAARLAKWSAPGIELIKIEEDGGIQIDYLLNQGGEEMDEDAAEMPERGYTASGYTPNGSNNGNGSNGNGNDGPVVVSSRRNSNSYQSNARRQHDKYWRDKANRDGKTYQKDGVIYAPEKALGFAEDLGENLTPRESKPHALTDESSAEMGQNLTLNSHAEALGFSPARVGTVNNVVGGFKDSYTSDNSFPNVAEKNLTPQNLTPTSQQNLTATAGSTLAGSTPAGSTGRPSAPPPRPPLRAQDVPAARLADVRGVLRAVGDDPEKWTAQWSALWKHCYEHDLLQCWDEGVAMLAWRLKVSPPSGRGAILNKGTWLRGTIMPLLAKAGAPYVPKAQGDQEPEDPAEIEEARLMVLETKARWEAETEADLKRVTPLEDILPGDGSDEDSVPSAEKVGNYGD